MDHEEALRRQFVREARIGVTLIGVTLAVFVVVAFYKMSGRFSNETNLETAAANVTASTLNPPAKRTHAANATVAAIQAATRSVVDQVEPHRGDTSPTQSPPMPIPKIFSADAIPSAESPEKKSAPADDSSAQIKAGEPDQRMPSVLPSPVAAKPPSFAAAPQITSAKSDKSDYYATLAGNANGPTLVAALGAESDEFVQLAAGDSLWAIAQRHYGDGRYFRALAAYNGLDQARSAEKKTGNEIRLPTLEQLRADFPTLMPSDFSPTAADDAAGQNGPPAATTYVTQVDDTLFAIARDHLGQASRYVEIIKLNAKQLPADVTSSTKLPAGMRLVLARE